MYLSRSISMRSLFDDDDSLSAEFMMEVEKEGPEHLSTHRRPQLARPEDGPKGLKKPVYSFDHQGMRIIGLNSNIRDSTRLRRQTDWLKETLAEAQEEAHWTVLTMHHPMFSPGEGRSNGTLRKLWTPLFDEYQADLVVPGHDTPTRGGASRTCSRA